MGLKHPTSMEPDWKREPDYDALVRAHQTMAKSPAEGLHALKELADRGSPMSMLYIGAAYATGQGVPIDLDEAIVWFRRSADAGCLRAYYDLGRQYLKTKQYGDAKEAFEAAAAQNFAPALHMLGRVYYFGYGVPKDRSKAKALLRQAANAGNVFAKRLLAHDLMHSPDGLLSRGRGLLLQLSCYVDAIFIAFTEGTSSDRLR